MAVQYVPIPPTEVTGTVGSEQTLFTVPGSGTTRLTLYATNHSGTARDITAHFVASGGAVADGTQLVSAVAVGVGDDPKLLTADLVLGAGGTIRIAASAANNLNVYGQYRIIT